MSYHLEGANRLIVRLHDGTDREIDLRLVHSVTLGRNGRTVLTFYGGADPLLLLGNEHYRVERAWRVQQERRAAVNEVMDTPKNLSDHDRPFVEGGTLSVISWCRDRDAKSPPEAVVLLFDVTIADVPLTLLQRYKTRGAVDGLIDALTRHREDVWPTR